MEPEIIFEDNHILVVYKPEGMAVETAKITEVDLMSYLKKYLGKEQPYLSMIHRLDQPVEGLLVFAKTPFAAKELSRQVQNNLMKKTYLAAVSIGEPDSYVINQKVKDKKNQKKTLEDYLFKDGRTNTSKVVSKETKGAKKAVLHYELAEANYQEGIAIAEIELVTGRHHQIRVQMSHAGMPLLGDVKYGNESSKEKSTLHQIKQTALCAYKLEFTHPKTGKTLSFSIEPKKKIFNQMV
ncbi:MAG: RluA family pseudouridine synthase [Lachnospiraceae bacterium]|nr:RluA family pseudouridine synthase [Lachnospiraceae bacterium]